MNFHTSAPRCQSIISALKSYHLLASSNYLHASIYFPILSLLRPTILFYPPFLHPRDCLWYMVVLHHQYTCLSAAEKCSIITHKIERFCVDFQYQTCSLFEIKIDQFISSMHMATVLEPRVQFPECTCLRISGKV